MLAAIAAAGRLRVPVEEATRACWCAAHGVTSLLAGGYFSAQDSPVALLRDGLIAQLTTAPAGRRARLPRGQKGNRPWHVANRRGTRSCRATSPPGAWRAWPRTSRGPAASQTSSPAPTT